jgi:hypothetical protein
VVLVVAVGSARSAVEGQTGAVEAAEVEGHAPLLRDVECASWNASAAAEATASMEDIQRVVDTCPWAASLVACRAFLASRTERHKAGSSPPLAVRRMASWHLGQAAGHPWNCGVPDYHAGHRVGHAVRAVEGAVGHVAGDVRGIRQSNRLD